MAVYPIRSVTDHTFREQTHQEWNDKYLESFGLITSDGTISQDKMAEKIGVSKRAIEMQIANLKAKGLLVREGADHGGYWRIVVKP